VTRYSGSISVPPDEAKASLRCIEPECQTIYPLNEPIYACRQCTALLEVSYDFKLPLTISEMKRLFQDRKSINSPIERSGVWRFRELLPFVGLNEVVTLGEGNTPLYSTRRCAEYAGLPALRFKHLGMNPTGSFKDYGMTTAVTQARALGRTIVACASTGNTSASMAAYAARADLRALVFIPAGQVSLGKLSQSLEYGATVVEIEGNFDGAMRVVRELSQETGIYLLNSVNPFRLEGQKTIMFELAEQLDWKMPDWIVLPGGNLGNVSAVGKALRELSDLGFVSKVPRLGVIQAEGAAPFYDLFAQRERSELASVDEPSTLATAIRIGNPVSWKKAIRAVEWTRGAVERVTEQQIADAKAVIGRDGIGCEPASAATLAGIKNLIETGTIQVGDEVIGILTGHLLKDPGYTMGYHSNKLELERHGVRESIKGRFANCSVRVAANKQDIKNALGL
jgi:threonine synthase